MKVPFIAAAILAAVISCSAVDLECIYRKEHGLPMHWAKPTDCGSFYRCTNKNIVRDITCPSGKEYNSQNGKCVAPGRNVCKLSLQQPLAAADNVCAGQDNGAYVADAGFCRNFYVCNDNAAFKQTCDPLSYFDLTNRACIPDPNKTCWQNKCIGQANGVYLPDSTSCTTFYVCANNEATKQTCGPSSFFDTTSKNCKPDNDNDICFENFCIGKPDNTLIADPESCTAYYYCSNQQVEARECPTGSYFDEILGACTAGVCPDTTTTESCAEETTTVAAVPDDVCCGKADGTVVADPNDCYGYFYCMDQQGTKTQCLSGYYFDKTNGVCTLGACPTNEVCTCPGGYEQGEFIKHPDDCTLFYICNAGQLVEYSCQPGNYFNPIVSACLPDTDDMCQTTVAPTASPAATKTKTKSKQKGKGKNNREKRSINDVDDIVLENDALSAEVEAAAADDKVMQVTAVEPAFTCLGIYREGQFVPHVDDCRKFQICYDGELYEQSCGIGNYFNAAENVCSVDVDNLCRIQPVPVIDAPNTVANTTNCTCPGGYPEGAFLPYPGECSMFYICHDQLLVESSCGEGMLFDNVTLACVPDTNNICWPTTGNCNTTDVCAGQPDGTTLPVEYQCNAFYYCSNNTSTPYLCDTGDYYNATIGICLPDTEAVCINPCANTTGTITTLPHPDCTKYYLCNNGETYVQNCSQGYYDITTGVCSITAVCPTAFCQGQNDYTTFPVPGNSEEFYICIGGAAELKQCLPGTSYSATVGVCLPAPSTNCNQTMCPNGDEAFPTISGESNAFCFCKDDGAYIEYCPSNYTFNVELGICYSNAPCDPLVCPNNPDYYVFINRNSTDSFCMCVAKQAVIVDCPAGTTFNPSRLLCLAPSVADQNCVPNSCVGVEDYTAIAPIPGLNGFCFCYDNESTYYNCPQNSNFNPSLGICQSPLPADQACNAALCATETVFPTVNDPYSFCYCLDNGSVILEHCADGTQFNPDVQVCLMSPCNPDICLGQSNGTTFPANDYVYGFCECTNQQPQLVPCLGGYMYNAERGVCLPESDFYCDVTLCINATINSPYAVPAINDTNGFCYCTGPNNVMKLSCPNNSTFNSTLGICMTGTQNGCTCPGGYADGDFLPHPTDCQLFYICTNTRLVEQNCGAGNYFNATLSACQADATGICTTAAALPSGCVGAYEEGDIIPHPINQQLFLICSESQLQELDCGDGNVFSDKLGVCINANSMNVRKRSVPVEEFPCVDGGKRSVPANCSQYELCVGGVWRRRSCTNQRYYNPEQQICLEPRDDTVCSYAKVSGLPACTNATEWRTHPTKNDNCGQYYQCTHEKWRLKSCASSEYYSIGLHACISAADANICNKLKEPVNATQDTSNCQHTTVRFYAHNCAMYLMCRENEWWYQYCPPGMYFNRTHNFCMPNKAGECSAVTAQVEPTDAAGNRTEIELSVLNCTRDGALRPSAFACDSYYMCVNGKWQPMQCKQSQYFNVTAEACIADDQGICAELKSVCVFNETREFPLNCTAFERCVMGQWQRFNCPAGYAFDSIVGECILNDGRCLAGGLRKACSAGESRSHPNALNCTQFYYCDQDKWEVGTCLKGNTYDVKSSTCVPHANENKCIPAASSTLMSTADEDACFGKTDGIAVPHADDCSRFYICLNGSATKEMYCTTGSYFDPKLGYCLPNDGSCRIPLTGACANATDGAFVPHPYDCRAYYHCSTLNGTQLLTCPEGEYYHKFTHQCRIDHGQCHQATAANKCAGQAHGMLLPHETYCNIYYACVRGLAIPVECPKEYIFNDVLGHCVYDVAHQCENGNLTGNGTKYSCGNITDGVYLPDRSDCTRYYICTNGEAVRQRCGAGTYFDSQELLCVADDGSCPYVDDDQPNNQHVPPDPIVCEGKHGNMMPDPGNCNEFYVCINGKLRHERCYSEHFFNATSYQCQPYQHDTVVETETAEATAMKVIATRSTNTSKQCTDKPTNYTDLCAQIPEGGTIAEQGDCRRYVTCEDNAPVTLRCRNGESYDSLLGFCRQNDGTCLLENGERVGVCNKHHGQLLRDAENCRGYFVCINGQRIPGECAEDEYFSKTENMCQKDVLAMCTPNNAKTDEASTPNCAELNETLLYPYVQNQCRSYFQCVKGVPKVYECADGLYFNATTTRCVKEITECSMSVKLTVQRADFEQRKSTPKCENLIVNYPYANIEDQCQSFYVCQLDGTIAFEKCADGKLFSDERGICIEAKLVKCTA